MYWDLSKLRANLESLRLQLIAIVTTNTIKNQKRDGRINKNI